jgi:hypothetical protein
MSKPKSKLGSNPLIEPQGVAALFSSQASGATSLPAHSKTTPKCRVSKPTRTPDKQGDKSVSHLVNKVTSPAEGVESVKRHTFYLTEAQGQKIKLYALLYGLQISEVIRKLINEHLEIKP